MWVSDFSRCSVIFSLLTSGSIECRRPKLLERTCHADPMTYSMSNHSSIPAIHGIIMYAWGLQGRPTWMLKSSNHISTILSLPSVGIRTPKLHLSIPPESFKGCLRGIAYVLRNTVLLVPQMILNLSYGLVLFPLPYTKATQNMSPFSPCSR